MISKLIEDQLKKCNRCEIPSYDENTTSLIIPKNSIKRELSFVVDNYYLIEIADYVLNPPPGFFLAQNWNNGINPPSKYMNVCCIQKMGNMVRVDGISFNIENNSPGNLAWTGWLPLAAVKIIKEI